MGEDEFTYWVEPPAGTKHVVFEDLPHLIALALWPEAEEESDARDFGYGGARINLEKELPRAVEDGLLKVRDPLTLGLHTFPMGAALKRALVLLPDLRSFLAQRGGGIGVRVASSGRSADSRMPTPATSYLYRLELPLGTTGLSVADALTATALAVHPAIAGDTRAEFQASIARLLTMKDHASHLWLQVENNQVLPRSPLTGRVPELAPQAYPDNVRDAWLLPMSELRKLCDSLGIGLVQVEKSDEVSDPWPQEIGGQTVWSVKEAFAELARQQGWHSSQGDAVAQRAIEHGSGLMVRDRQGLKKKSDQLSGWLDHLFTSDVNEWLERHGASYRLMEGDHKTAPHRFSSPTTQLTLAQFNEAVLKVEDPIPGVEWVTWAEAKTWLEDRTGERWELPRLVGSAVGLGVWISPTPDQSPVHIQHVFQGRWQGFMAELTDGHDRRRLQVERTCGVLSLTRRPDGTALTFTPPLEFAADEVKVLALDLKRLALCVRQGIYPDKAEPVVLHAGDESIVPDDPGFAAWLALHGGPESMVGAQVQRIKFTEFSNAREGALGRPSVTSSVPFDASESARPMQALAAQEEAIVAKLIAMSYSPLALPTTEPGMPGVKALVRGAIGKNPLFQSSAVFNKAWQRLRDAKRIAEVHELNK